ncbi:hypothetical protein NQ315_004025 [Exocentrus adspersus]|uniref:Beta-1,4-N-acetylgalactosaminyltransferase n=1 Tax=Exocentrus adspersus TaxID=1586481 RepID=A0AAV8W6L6_9CUCU|nr:hypothetical protein NQ315_004025 [Exocentrus adspersus]
MLKNCLLAISVVLIIVSIYFPARHARHYSYILKDNISSQLKLHEPRNKLPNLKTCTYQNIILNSEDVDINSINERKSFQQPLAGGEFKPKQCTASINAAIIVPYRNRTRQLNIFLNYMHHFLQKQNIHYRIFIVDQNDTLPFNRAKMLNYGAKLAISLKYDCLILHDVDLLPLNTGNIYGCTKCPRHMSSSLDTFRYNLPYLTLFGGAVSILSQQFQEINGMSNKFYGWGAEDDNFYRRVIGNGLQPCRLPPEVSRYTMLFHNKEKANENRFKLLETLPENPETDGLNSLPHPHVIKLEHLYTHLVVS